MAALEFGTRGSAGQDAGDDLPTMPAILPKFGIGREDDWIAENLGHAHQTGIGETHRNVSVLLHER